jgi:hypothetical protein
MHGTDAGNNTNWVFSMALSQSVYLEQNATYKISGNVSTVGTVTLSVGSSYTLDMTNSSGVFSHTFTHTDVDGDYTLKFDPTVTYYGEAVSAVINSISLKKVNVLPGVDNLPVKEFLVGNTDDGDVIFFRADLQTIHFQESAQLLSNPVAIATEIERGTQTKLFISLDDKPFFQLEGTVTKDVSILKPATSSNIDSLDQNKPPLASAIKLSYRDSSKNLCRIIQTAIISNPTPIDYVP